MGSRAGKTVGAGPEKGIYPRESSILIYFTWGGKSYRETLKLAPTPKNLEYARRTRNEILRRIELGTFDLGEFFPRSKHAKHSDDGPEIMDAIADYLGSKERSLARTTLREYRNALVSTLGTLKGRVGTITFGDLDAMLREMNVSGKTHNNLASTWRGFFRYGLKRGWVDSNPADGIETAKRTPPEPDPLDGEEMEAVIADMAQHYHPQIANYFEGALWLGWRPSEGIALDWGAIDWRKGLLRVSAARVRGIDKETKTGRARDVELDDRALAMFRRQKEHTFMAGGRIFTNPVTGEKWWDTADLVAKYWRPSLKRLGLRDRDARQARHTCATMLLMAGCKPAWCAAQLGHSVEMYLRVYSRWLPDSDRGREREKLETFTVYKPGKTG